MTRQNWRTMVLVAVLSALVWRTFFTVDETQHVIVTQFGRPMRQIVGGPGLHAKLPFQSLVRFDNRLLLYDPTASEFLTMDKKNVLIDTYVGWQISDPLRFLQAVTNVAGAELRLHDIVWAELAATLGEHPLDALVSSDAPVKMEQIMRAVRDNCADGIHRCAAEERHLGMPMAAYGIEIVDVRIKRINLPEQNKQSVFDRMRAERERDAKRYRAEGDQEALKIRADADKQREVLLSEAYREAGRIKGEGEATATRIYAEAYNRDPEFYKLTRTLEAYEKVFDKNTTALLSSDAELLRIMTRGPKAVQEGR